MPADRHVILLGLMGAGKTRLGRRVAERLGRELLDGDDILEERTGGRTAAEVVEAEGVERLHELEAEIALACVARSEPAVIGPAASVIESDIVRDAMVGHFVVWLTGPVPYLAEKAQGKAHRPFVNDGDPVALFTAQMAVREPLALALAALVIDVSAMPREAQVEAVIAQL